MAKSTPKPEVKKNIRTLAHLEISYVDVHQLVPNDYNPNRQSDQDFELLLRSIEEDGFTQPVLVRRGTNRIVDGEHRWRACTILGEKNPKWWTIPVVYCDMTDEQAMIATLRHNRARGNEDLQKAADVIRELSDLGALDHAADSLMMDQVELDMFTRDVPEAELHLRTPDMSINDVEATLQAEAELLELKRKEEEMMGKSDRARYTRQMTFMEDEAYFIKAIIGRQQAEGILNLCRACMAEGLL